MAMVLFVWELSRTEFGQLKPGFWRGLIYGNLKL
jgi:hypothetical protein